MSRSPPKSLGSPMWKIPPEHGPHRQTWMAFPWDKRIWRSDLEAAQNTVADLVRTISQFEKVSLLVPPKDERRFLRRFKSREVEVIAAKYNDIWVRDTLPTFAVGSDKSLVAIDWHFNGWGSSRGLNYKQDLTIGRSIARMAGATVIEADVVAEGGAFAFDGHDIVVATQSVMLHSRRNATHDQIHLQKALQRASQCKSICWLPGDKFEKITRGHADSILAFVNNKKVLFHWIEDEQCSERKVCEKNLQAFERWMDKERRKYEIIKLPSLSDCEDQYGASYINFAHVNGAVVVPAYKGRFSKYDDRAWRIIEEVFEKPAVSVPITSIAAYGGGIHCATQQEPISLASASQL
jgi:agmatine deiminase